MVDADRHFVLSNWLHGAAVGPLPGLYKTEGVDSEQYWLEQRARIASLLARSVVLVAELEDGLIGGWICAEGCIVHYCYVRLLCREHGILKALRACLVGDAAHRA